jgi:pyruvate/2-oxoglutarate dehydrogenase complex dihydrolipoamide dehydrogenase (E3) component
MKYDYHLIVIGAGSGGLVAASGTAAFGAKVALIEEDKMGGDCLNAGCVPSKSFLKSAHLAADITGSEELGLSAELKEVDLAKVMGRVSSVIDAIAPHDSVERYEGLGVKVIKGRGELIDTHSVKAGEQTITGKHIVIATGSEPVVPPIKGLNEVPYLTNKNIFQLETLPKHLIVLGAGPIGLELGQGFRHLGSKVTVIDMLPSLFGKDDPEVGPIMEKRLKDDGIELLLSAKIMEVKKGDGSVSVVIERDGQLKEVSGDQVLVSLGRKPVSKGLGLENAGVKVNERGHIIANPKLQTTAKNIYACGDVVGPYQFTHMAGYQAGIIVRNIIFPFSAKVDYSCVPWTTYTKPEVAHVGYTQPWAKAEGLFVDSLLIDLAEMDRAKTENDMAGFLKLILGKKGRIIGATIVGEKGGEMIPLATLAIKQKLKSTAFLGLIFSYPTEAEIFKFASLAAIKKSFKPWMKNLVKKLFVR